MTDFGDGGFTATPENSAQNKYSGLTDKLALPAFPGEDLLAHEGTLWIEQAEARFGTLLAVAQGHPPAQMHGLLTLTSRLYHSYRLETQGMHAGWSFVSDINRRMMQTCVHALTTQWRIGLQST